MVCKGQESGTHVVAVAIPAFIPSTEVGTKRPDLEVAREQWLHVEVVQYLHPLCGLVLTKNKENPELWLVIYPKCSKGWLDHVGTLSNEER